MLSAKKLCYCICALLLFASCSQNAKLSPRDYIAYFRDSSNGLTQKEAHLPYTFSVQLKTPEYIALSESANEGKVDAQQYEERKKSLEGNLVFQVNMNAGESREEFLRAYIEGEEEYQARLNYFITAAQKDLYLLVDGDTLHCNEFHFERNYGITTSSTLNAAFQFSKKLNDLNKLTLVFDEKVLGTGAFRFDFPASKIHNIPQLSL